MKIGSDVGTEGRGELFDADVGQWKRRCRATGFRGLILDNGGQGPEMYVTSSPTELVLNHIREVVEVGGEDVDGGAGGKLGVDLLLNRKRAEIAAVNDALEGKY